MDPPCQDQFSSGRLATVWQLLSISLCSLVGTRVAPALSVGCKLGQPRHAFMTDLQGCAAHCGGYRTGPPMLFHTSTLRTKPFQLVLKPGGSDQDVAINSVCKALSVTRVSLHHSNVRLVSTVEQWAGVYRHSNVAIAKQLARLAGPFLRGQPRQPTQCQRAGAMCNTLDGNALLLMSPRLIC